MERTATKMVAPSVALGRKYNSGVRKSATRAMPTAVKTPAAGVSAPASKLTMDREKPPATGNPPDIEAPILAAPKANNSWLGSICCRFLAASVWATEIEPTYARIAISNAGVTNWLQSLRSKGGDTRLGSPVGTSPTIFTPCLSSPNPETIKIVMMMAMTGPIFARIPASLLPIPALVRRMQGIFVPGVKK